MKYSVVILNYNVKYFLDACLQSVLRSIEGKNAEIIVADNNSTDDSKAYFKDKYPQVKFLWFDNNSGFATAYNKSVQQAKGEFLLILNPDTLVSEDVLDALDRFAQSHPDFGIIGGKMLDGTGNFLPESKRGIPTPIVAFSKLTKLYKLLNFSPFNKYYALHLAENQNGEVDILTGAFMYIKKENYQAIGGFDERYFMYGEDIDLSYTMLKSGKQNYYLPDAKIIHFKGESAVKDSTYFKRFLDTTFMFYNKHYRSFAVQEFLMKSFFKLWLFLRIKKHSATENITDYKKIYFITNSDKKIENATTIKLTDADKDIISDKSLIIFDTDQLAFSEMISFMEEMRKKKLLYRFRFNKIGLMIGSDWKDSLGVVENI